MFCPLFLSTGTFETSGSGVWTRCAQWPFAAVSFLSPEQRISALFLGSLGTKFHSGNWWFHPSQNKLMEKVTTMFFTLFKILPPLSQIKEISMWRSPVWRVWDSYEKNYFPELGIIIVKQWLVCCHHSSYSCSNLCCRLRNSSEPWFVPTV